MENSALSQPSPFAVLTHSVCLEMALSCPEHRSLLEQCLAFVTFRRVSPPWQWDNGRFLDFGTSFWRRWPVESKAIDTDEYASVKADIGGNEQTCKQAAAQRRRAFECSRVHYTLALFASLLLYCFTALPLSWLSPCSSRLSFVSLDGLGLAPSLVLCLVSFQDIGNIYLLAIARVVYQTPCSLLSFFLVLVAAT